MGRIVLSHFMLLVAISGCAVSSSPTRGSQAWGMVQQAFPSATGLRDVAISPNARGHGHSDQIEIKAIESRGGDLGYCVSSTVAARSGPFRIRVLVDSNFHVTEARVVSYPWVRGRDIQKAAFTDQFEGKGPEASLRIGEDIDAMTGATLSSRAMTQGVKDTIVLLRTLEQNDRV